MNDTFLDPGGQPVGSQDIVLTRTRELTSLLASGVLSFARMVECRKAPSVAENGEAVIFEVAVERPQLLAHPIHRVERVMAVFNPTQGLPEVLVLRADFPLTPHINLRTKEFPRSLCLDARPWQEISRRWTAAWFVERVRWWLAQTARGTLHQDDQPLEPLILDTTIPLILPADLLSSPLHKQDFLEVASLPGPQGTYALRAERVVPRGEDESCPAFVAIALRCSPQPHGVIRHHPNTLEELHALTSAAGLDLKLELKERFRGWQYQARVRSSRLIILLSLPKQRQTGGPIEDADHFAVACFDSVRELAVKLGVWRQETQAQKKRQRRKKGAPRPAKSGDPINVHLLRPVFGLTPSRAAQLCGDPPRATARRVAVGAGALGSQVLLNLARAGYGGWEIIDDDRLFPHNLQRHALDGFAIGYAKAKMLALRLNSLFDGPPVSAPISANLLDPGEKSSRIEQALADSSKILDFSASVAVARYLTWRTNVTGRLVSMFLNPGGTDLVLLAEDVTKGISLDSVEMQYYRMVLREPKLANHLRSAGGPIRYSTSCRDVSTHLPTHLVALHAAIGAGAIGNVLERPEAAITIWQADRNTLAVAPIHGTPATTRRRQMETWTLILDDGLLARLSALRAAKLPNETGGVLLGAYDMDRRVIYVVDTLPSPPDSAEWPTLYIRGSDGLSAQVVEARLRTGAQIEYVGEWHSHPDHCSTLPSDDDRRVFTWLTTHLVTDGLPALMAIVGERASSSWYLEEMRSDTRWSVTNEE
ncbi:hypothetical protein BH10PLA2_BH10PLA2_12020 [soil metagenome]